MTQKGNFIIKLELDKEMIAKKKFRKFEEIDNIVKTLKIKFG